MKKIIRLTETDLTKLIKRVINEQVPSGMGTQKSYTRQPMSSKITINEFRKIVKRILKENIDYPKLDFSKKDSEGYFDRWELDSQLYKIDKDIKEYIINNIKVYNCETNSYEPPISRNLFGVRIRRSAYDIVHYEGVNRIELDIFSRPSSLQIKIFFSEVKDSDSDSNNLSKPTYNELKTDVKFYVNDNWHGCLESQPMFETEKDLDLILEVLKKYAENYMNRNLNITSLKEEIKSKDPNNLLFKNSRNSDSQDKTKISSSEFRRGGEISFGKSGDFKAEKKFDRRGGEINVGQKLGDYKGKFTK